MNLAWYRRTKDLVPLLDPKVHFLKNSLIKILAQLLWNFFISFLPLFIFSSTCLFLSSRMSKSASSVKQENLRIRGPNYVVSAVCYTINTIIYPSANKQLRRHHPTLFPVDKLQKRTYIVYEEIQILKEEIKISLKFFPCAFFEKNSLLFTLLTCNTAHYYIPFNCV